MSGRQPFPYQPFLPNGAFKLSHVSFLFLVPLAHRRGHRDDARSSLRTPGLNDKGGEEQMEMCTERGIACGGGKERNQMLKIKRGGDQKGAGRKRLLRHFGGAYV